MIFLFVKTNLNYSVDNQRLQIDCIYSLFFALENYRRRNDISKIYIETPVFFFNLEGFVLGFWNKVNYSYFK